MFLFTVLINSLILINIPDWQLIPIGGIYTVIFRGTDLLTYRIHLKWIYSLNLLTLNQQEPDVAHTFKRRLAERTANGKVFFTSEKNILALSYTYSSRVCCYFFLNYSVAWWMVVTSCAFIAMYRCWYFPWFFLEQMESFHVEKTDFGCSKRI